MVAFVRGAILVFMAILSVQFGGAFAATLIPRVGALGTVALRMSLAAIVLAPIVRPRIKGHTRADWRRVLALTIALAGMNTVFYFSLERLPLGVAVTVEFLGPLGMAAFGSRSLRDWLAIALAGCGVVEVSGALTTDWSQLDVVGLVLALVAGVFWALYATSAQLVGMTWPKLEGLWWAILFSSIVLVPSGLVTAGIHLVAPRNLFTGAVVAVMSSALPYSLEMYALRHIDTMVYGVLTGVEPAVAATAGFLILGQNLTVPQMIGMTFVVAAAWLVMARNRQQE
ncbi:EamA family transporter [Cutibacterium sp. WCA-380-WT-3A]|uniref:EamA family transporter n=1 Tax=Cutibacterium porci TaxID=2605781 RepID=A0A7K0J6Y7_9ACTN|nr:EamA family transporter [Cutibacterium porci]MSS45721.1 EamA family transporter [Cutibacterium porci]